MEYKINPGAYSGIFPVPTAIVDENIRLASVVQLKVILFLLRHSSTGQISTEDIAKNLFLDKEDVKDALIFWRERGIVIESNENPVAFSSVSPVQNATEKQSEIPKVEEKKVVAQIPISRPSHEQIAARLKESEEIAELFREAQAVLGKTVGYDGQSVLIMMHDSYGLPVEVILMAIQYAVDGGKSSFSNIAKIGRIWSELEIDTIEGASEYIEQHSVVNSVWNELRSLTNIHNNRPTTKQFDYLKKWIKEYGYDANMLYYAYEESVERTGKMSLPYMDKIITNWYKNSVKTPKDIQTQKLLWQQSQAKKNPSKKNQSAFEERDPSYDASKFLKKATDLKYDKNDKN